MSTHRDKATDMERELAGINLSAAAVMLIIVGVCQLLLGIAAAADDDILVAHDGYAFELDVTAWGWIHIVLGICAIAAGLGTLARSWWAELGGVIAATLGIMSCFLFLPYFPLWTIVLIAMYAFIVWTTTHELVENRP